MIDAITATARPMNSTPRSPRPTDPEFIKIRKMNPITAFLAFALLAAAAGMGYFVNLYLGATFFVVAVLVGTSLKMANVWQKFVILRMGKLQSVKGAASLPSFRCSTRWSRSSTDGSRRRFQRGAGAHQGHGPGKRRCHHLLARARR